MQVGDVIIENGSEYEVGLDRSTERSERFTLNLKNGRLHQTGDSFVVGIKRFSVIYSTEASKRITIKG